MRHLFLILSLVTLGACASNPSTSSDNGRVQTQSLAPGKCGLFGWTTDEKRSFVFYADEKTARYDDGSGAKDLEAQTKFPAVAYKDPAGNDVELRLGQGELMDGGMRYPGARVVTTTAEGWERLRPVAIVRTCQPK